MAINCWEFNKCGREAGGNKVTELGICPAAIATEVDGFLGGKNGGRGCAYIVGTFCSGIIDKTIEDKEKRCFECDFYQKLKKEQRREFNMINFNNYVTYSKKMRSQAVK